MKKEDLAENSYVRSIRPLDESLMEECLAIIDNVSKRKAEVVNWDEKKLLDEATKRSGRFLHKEDDTESAEEPKKKKILTEETAGAVSDKEKGLMSGLGDILRGLEQLDDQKK